MKEVDLEGTVLLNCSASSVPPSDFTWKLNGTAVSEKSNVLTINKPKFEDSGTYTCEARNPITGKTVTFTHVLSVKGELIIASVLNPLTPEMLQNTIKKHAI